MPSRRLKRTLTRPAEDAPSGGSPSTSPRDRPSAIRALCAHGQTGDLKQSGLLAGRLPGSLEGSGADARAAVQIIGEIATSDPTSRSAAPEPLVRRGPRRNGYPGEVAKAGPLHRCSARVPTTERVSALVSSNIGSLGVLDPLIDLLNDNTPIFPPWGRVAIVVLLLLAAWLVSKGTGSAARHVLHWRRSRHAGLSLDDTGEIANLKREETTISIVRGAVTAVAFATAFFLVIAQFTGGVDGLKTVLGASFLLLLVAFGMQRLLHDVVAGMSIFLERWYSVGDAVVLQPNGLQGVVEDVTLRRTKLRSLSGEVIHVPNAQISAARILPRGLKRFAVEIYVSGRDKALAAFDAAARLLPVGPTYLAELPRVDEIEELSDALTRLRAHVAVVPGREWLVESFLVDLLREHAGAVLVHGPVVFHVDEDALASYSRLPPTGPPPARFGTVRRHGARGALRVPRRVPRGVPQAPVGADTAAGAS